MSRLWSARCGNRRSVLPDGHRRCAFHGAHYHGEASYSFLYTHVSLSYVKRQDHPVVTSVQEVV